MLCGSTVKAAGCYIQLENTTIVSSTILYSYSIPSPEKRKRRNDQRSVKWINCQKLPRAITVSCCAPLLPGGGKFCKITKKGLQKNLLAEEFWWPIGPQFCQKVAERAWKICFYYFLCFQGQFRHKFNFLCCEHGFIIKYFLPKPLKNIYMTMHNFFCFLKNFFSNWPRNLGKTSGNSVAGCISPNLPLSAAAAWGCRS